LGEFAEVVLQGVRAMLVLVIARMMEVVVGRGGFWM